MKSLLPTFLIPFLILCCQGVEKEKTELDKKEALLKQIQQFNKAFDEGNVDLLRTLVTDNYLHTNGHSASIRKEPWFNYLKNRRNALLSGDLVIENYAMEDIEVELYGDAAIVTARISFTSSNKGNRTENAYRVTNVWVLQEGRWRRAGFHDTRIP